VLTLGFPQKIAFGSNYQGGDYHSDDNHCNKSFLPWGKKDWTWKKERPRFFLLPARNQV
jgi:hypothetical protein